MLFLIFIAIAVFWTGISIGIYAGRRHANSTTRPAGNVPAVSGGGSPVTTSPSAAAGEQLKPGDRIEIRISGLTGPGVSAAQAATVDPQGNVVIPHLGVTRAHYLTPAQLTQAIMQSYRAKNLLPPGPIEVVRLPVGSAPTTAPAGR